MKPKKSLESLSKKKPEMFPEEAANGKTAIEVRPEDVQTLPAPQSPDDRERAAFLMACGDGLPINVEQAKQDIRQCYGRMLGDILTIGKRLLLIKEQLPHGGFLQYLENEFPESERTAQKYMLLAQRFMEHKSENVFGFAQVVAGKSREKAFLTLGISDEEIEAAQQSGEFLGRSLEEVGGMSYRQLKEEIRKRERDLERSRTQRDKAETKIADLEEENRQLRDVYEGEEVRPLTALEMEFGRTVTQLARLLGVAQATARDAEEEITRDGPAYIARLMQEFNLLTKTLQPWDPADIAAFQAREERAV